MCQSRIKYFFHQQQHNFYTGNIKSYHQRKTFWEIFAAFNFSIVLLAAQVNRKIEVTSNSPTAVIKLPCVFTNNSRHKGYICVKMMAKRRIFVFANFFFLSSVLVSSLTRNVRIQHKDHNRRTLEVDHCFYKVKNSMSLGNSIVFNIQAALLFISVTNLGLICRNSSTLLPDPFTFVIYARPAGLLTARTCTLNTLL